MRKQHIILKQVGCKNETESRAKTIRTIIDKKGYQQRQKNVFQQEVDPQQQTFFTMMEKQKQRQRSECKKKFTLIQDPRKSSFAYRKYIIIDKIVSMLTLSSLILGAIKTEIDINKQAREDQLCLLLMNMITAITILLELVVLIRYVCQFVLEAHQKKVYVLKKSLSERYNLKILSFIQQSPSFRYWITEAILVFPHPMSWIASVQVQLFQSYDEVYLPHYVNDILSLFMLLRIFLILRSYVQLSIYSSPRASRLCSQNNANHNIGYSIKCMVNEEPLLSIALCYTVSCLILAFGLKLSEGMFPNNLSGVTPTSFQSFGNCLWCIFITMTTVGYGDYYPKTIPGRSVAVCAAIMGVILGSLLIVALSNYLTMQISQSKSHITLARLVQQKRLASEANQALAEAVKLSSYLSSRSNYENNKTNQLQKIFVLLKQKIDRVKMRNRRIKSIVDSDNVIQQMNRLFQITKDSLIDVFKNQTKLKIILQSMQKQQHMRLAYVQTSFDRQVHQVLKDLQQ